MFHFRIIIRVDKDDIQQTKKRGEKMMDAKGIEMLEELIFELTQELIIAKDVAADAIFAHQDVTAGNTPLKGAGVAHKAMTKACKEVKSLENAIAMHRDTINWSLSA